MKEFSGYEKVAKIAEGSERVIYRAQAIADQKSVVIKTLKRERPSTENIALMYHEYEMGKDLDSPELIHTYALMDQQNQYALVLEDFGGISLHEYLYRNPIKNLSVFFKLTIAMVRCLEKLHRYNIIHKDIKPSNFLIHPESLKIKLGDFNYSSKLMHELQDLVPPNKLEGTLAYMAPEQTGRMNMNIDYRSDFYALGVSFYEMLSGHVPFSYEDPLELLHAHLTNPIPVPDNDALNIPPVVVKIIQKLMSKNPKDRYQSAIGLQRDLERAQAEFEKNGKVEDFDLGKNDNYDRLNLSQKLYGREKEVKALLNVYDSVSNGAAEAIMICGYSGIGKTMLINEVNRPMIKDKGYFISGKFDQLQRNTPYTAITQAFNQLIRYILAEPESKFEKIKKEIIEALGDVAQVMINLVPDLERLIGKQPELEKLPPQETLNRMKYFFGQFMKVVANQDHPLVLFIDDLQWADSGSLLLLESILTNESLSHILLIGAYRDNEVDEHHPLMVFLSQIRAKDKKVESLPLSPLGVEDFAALFRDSFNRKDAEVKSFAELIHKRTEGNPLFCKQLINRIYNEELLYFDYDRHRWDWKLQLIQNLKVSENVVELMLHKLNELPDKTQTLLKYASCLGNRFTIENLMLISGQSGDLIAKTLWPSLQQELIISLSLGYKRTEAIRNQDLASGLSKEIVYQFIHDRVQQAVHESMPENDRKKTHLMIARLLMKNQKEQPKREKLFEIVDHFNAAHSLLKDAEKLEVTNLNYQAALLAKEANAYQPMSKYLKNALDLLDETAWDEHYSLIFAIYREKALNLFLLNKISESEQQTLKLLTLAKNNFDKASIYRMQGRCYMSLGENEKGFEASKNALNLLGVNLPIKPSQLQLLFKILKLRWKMRNFNLEVFTTNNTATNPRIDAIFEILSDLFMPAYWYSMELFIYLSLTGLDFALQYKNAREASAFLSTYGTVLLMAFNDIDAAVELNSIALNLSRDYPNKYSTCFIEQSKAYLLNHLHSPFKAAMPYYQQVYQDATESGNYMMAASAQAGIPQNISAESRSLNEIIAALKNSIKIVKALGVSVFIPPLELSLILAQNNLQGAHDQAAQIKELESIVLQRASNLKYVSVARLSSYYYFMESFEQALYYHELWYPHEHTIRYSTGTYQIKTANALVLAKYWASSSGLKKRRYAKRFRKLKRELQWIAKKSPENYRHLYLFLQGVELQLKKRNSRALICFESGIENAKKQSAFLWVALGNELAGEMLVAQGQNRCAIDYIREAHYYYRHFGHGFKVNSLEKHYPYCFLEKAESTVDFIHQTVSGMPSISPASSGSTSMGLDFLSLIKASQAISSEIILEKLFEKILHIVIENAGAEKAFLLEKDNSAWMVTAKISREQAQENFAMLKIPLKDCENLPQNLIQYSLRSKEAVVLSNATEDPQYSHDPYILSAQPKSILSLPLLHHNKIVGILYLENNLTTNAFTQERVTVLTTLASQIVISLENARHFEEMESLYRSTERFVPKQFLEILQRKTIRDVNLGDSLRLNVSVLFSDIRGFTSLLEKLDTDAAIAFVNRFWAVIAPVIRKNRGFIDKYQGDGVLALFVHDADDAIMAGIEMHRILAEFNQEQIKNNAPVLEIGVGINSGPAMIGIIGEKERLEPTVVSDIANTASRVENLNKTYGTHLLISGDTFNALKNPEKFVWRILDKVRPKGKSLTTYLYEIIDWESQLQGITLSDYLKLFSESFSDYEAGNFALAKNKLQNCLSYRPSDQAAKLLHDRCDEFIQHGTPAGWDGVYTLTHK